MTKKTIVAGLALAAALALDASAAAALQGTGMGGQNLRPYWHVFIAYALTIGLVLGWVISIARRLKNVEKRLGE